jgi:anti-sigma factor RsiW
LNCQETQELIHGYLDGELDLVKSLEIERHLETCDGCKQSLENLVALRGAIRNNAPYFSAPADFRSSLRTALRKEAKGTKSERFSWNWLRIGSAFASIVALCIVVWLIVPMRAKPPSEDLLAKEIVSDHIRSMLGEHMMDVESSNQHTVKPWFDGKLEYAPQVTNLSDKGFTLVGGRLDYINGRRVAALVYQREKHFINLFTWPTDEKDSAPQLGAMQGYNMLHWNRNGMAYWAVSDLNAAELRTFTDLLGN